MTTELDARGTGPMTALVDADEQPHRRSTYTPPQGVAAVPASPSPASPSPASPGPALRDVSDDLSSTPAAPDFPVPPERGSLEDDILVPLVGRHTEDTAAIDLIGILQAQMHLRATEAARFAAWEERMQQIGTAEAMGEIERTRLHFTGVIPLPTAAQLARPVQPEPRPITPADRPAPVSAPVDASAVAPAPAVAQAPSVAPPTSRPAPTAGLAPTAAPPKTTPTRAGLRDEANGTTRILVIAFSGLALLVVIAALVLTGADASAAVSGSLAAVAVLAAAWIGIVAGRLALRTRSRSESAPVTSRTAWALVAGLVFGTAVGEGLVHTGAAGFAWQGYLLRLVGVVGLHAELSVVAGILGALVVAFVVVVLVDRVGTTDGSDEARES